MAPLNDKILRAGLYERVSTTEQAMKGYSIETQIENLEEYCKENKIKIVDHYTDEGVSGSKPPLKRPQLKRLIEDVEAGKIDIIIFTKLDRWFRNVQEYFKVQEILDKYNVPWKTIFEDYDTSTADGRLKVNIMLSVAANERERTSERIKVVFEHKRKNKEVCFGGTTFGYKKVKDENGVRRLVKNPETENIMQDFWDELLKHNQVNTAARIVQNKYGIQRSLRTWVSATQNEIYSGEYRGVKDFCEPYVSRKDWEKFQKTRTIKKTQNNRVYLFTGLIKCPSCGRLLRSNYTSKGNKEVKRYRCSYHQIDQCDHITTYSETKIEIYLLNNLEILVNKEIAKTEEAKATPKPQTKANINALKERLRRLTVSYMAGNIPDDEYLRDQAEIKACIAGAEKKELPEDRDVTPLKKVLEIDYKKMYETFTLEEKQRFWHHLIKEIVLEGSEIKDVIFW